MTGSARQSTPSVVLYTLTLTRARLLGIAPNPANDVLVVIAGDLTAPVVQLAKPGRSDAELLAGIKTVLEQTEARMLAGLPRLERMCSAEGRFRIRTRQHREPATPERWAWHSGFAAGTHAVLQMIRSRLGERPMREEG